MPISLNGCNGRTEIFWGAMSRCALLYAHVVRTLSKHLKSNPETALLTQP